MGEFRSADGFGRQQRPARFFPQLRSVRFIFHRPDRISQLLFGDRQDKIVVRSRFDRFFTKVLGSGNDKYRQVRFLSAQHLRELQTVRFIYLRLQKNSIDIILHNIVRHTAQIDMLINRAARKHRNQKLR